MGKLNFHEYLILRFLQNLQKYDACEKCFTVYIHRQTAEETGIRHISNLLPHYLAKFEFSTVTLYILISHNTCQTLISF